MNNIQINGQRRWGPPEDWSGPPPAHGTEVFIKNLPEEVFELELYAIFSRVGRVYEVRLPINWNGFNRGYAFLRFTAVRYADRAIQTLDGFEIRKNRMMKVTRSVDNTRLFLSAVPIEKNAEELRNDLLQYVENVKKVYVYPTLENRSLFRGYAFVEFETHRDAAIAKRILTPDICHSIFEKKCIAAWANPLPFLDQSVLKLLHVLFLRNIPVDIKGFRLKKIIESVIGDNEIKHIKRLNDFAFLTFKDHQSAERALSILQSVPYLIPENETQIEWAIPRDMVDSSLYATESYINKTTASENRMKENPSKIAGASLYSHELQNFMDFPSLNNFKSNAHKKECNRKHQEALTLNDYCTPRDFSMNRSVNGKENELIEPHQLKCAASSLNPVENHHSCNCSSVFLENKTGDKLTQAMASNAISHAYQSSGPLPHSRCIRDVEVTQPNSVFQNFSPGSECGSKGSDDCFFNSGSCSTSPFSSLSPAASTNKSPDSPAYWPEDQSSASSFNFEDVFVKKNEKHNFDFFSNKSEDDDYYINNFETLNRNQENLKSPSTQLINKYGRRLLLQQQRK